MISIEPSSGTVITGASDDLIEIEGELSEEFNSYGCSNGHMACSDGTLLKVDYAEDGIWRFRPIVKGNLFDKAVDGSVEEDTNDKTYFKPGLRWFAFSDEMQTVVKRNK